MRNAEFGIEETRNEFFLKSKSRLRLTPQFSIFNFPLSTLNSQLKNPPLAAHTTIFHFQFEKVACGSHHNFPISSPRDLTGFFFCQNLTKLFRSFLHSPIFCILFCLCRIISSVLIEIYYENLTKYLKNIADKSEFLLYNNYVMRIV